MANTRETMGEQACLDALVANTLTSFEDDGVTKVGASGLRNRTALTDVTLSQCKSVESDGLASCTNLEVVDMLGNGTIAGNAFSDDTKLAHLLLRGASKTTLSSTSAFSSTPIGSGTGAIYVPSDLLATYKADTNWSNYFITTLDKYPLSDLSTITESWAELDAMTQAQIEAKYAVGDTKLIDLGTEGKVYAQIAGFGHDDLANGSGKAKITFVFKAIIGEHRMNANRNTIANWSTTEMRSYLATDILPLMTSDLQAALKEVKKYSFAYTNSSTMDADVESSDKLFLLSNTEVGFTSGNLETKAVKYDIFDNVTRVMTKNGVAAWWWLRSAGGSNYFNYVKSNGTQASQYANQEGGVVLGFCI